MEKIVSHQYIYRDRDLFDYIIFGELSPEEYMNSEKIINEIGSTIDRIQKLNSGYCLMTVDIKKNHNIMLIVINDYATTYSSSKYKVYKLTERSDIENPVSFKLEEIDNEENLSKFIYEASKKRVAYNYMVSEEQIVSMIVTETLDGYKINKSLVEEFHNQVKRFQPGVNGTTSVPTEDVEYEHRLIKEAGDQLEGTLSNIHNRISKLLERIDDDSKVINLVYPIMGHPRNYIQARVGYGPESTVVVTHINDVRRIGNERVAFITNYRYGGNKSLDKWCNVIRYNPTTHQGVATNKDTHYVCEHGKRSTETTLTSIPYNYIDKGRYVVSIGNSNEFKMSVISNDPKIDSDFKEHLIQGMKSEVDSLVKENIQRGETKVVDHETETSLYLANFIPGNGTRPLRDILSATKAMADEFMYVVKRHKAEGSDIKITDNIMYNHAEGKISYNDFSISIDNEAVKGYVHDCAKNKMREFFRNEKTEQQVIDDLLQKFFSKLDTQMMGYSQSGTRVINVVLNDVVNVKIEANKGKNNFTYINEQRFNKNEVLVIIKEITCYRSQETADAFIRNVGKLGLSVYIGITSGYMFNERMYRFKKEKGRSNYKLLIDDIRIDISGKQILNKLYEFVQLSASSYHTTSEMQNIIDDIIFKSIGFGTDYIKYRFLINASYKAFMKKSKEFLEKKIKDVEGTHVKYHDTNRKTILEGIRIKGSSGNWYIIAYDSKESFVFMNPDEHEDGDSYKDGTYICMIDQSNIKTNIGYDTVVSKMLSLKNDSMIASQIYNLEEELNK